MPTYDPKEVSVIAGGALIEGYADGSFVNVVYNNDLWSTVVGADGEYVRSKSNDLSAQITITLLNTSISNPILFAFLQADISGNLGSFPLVITDANTLTTHTTEAAYIKKHPDRDYQKESQPVAWVLETGRLFSVHGSSTDNLV